MERWTWQEDEEEDVRNYWINLRTGEDTLIWRRKLQIALCEGNVLEEALDLSSDRIQVNEVLEYILCVKMGPDISGTSLYFIVTEYKKIFKFNLYFDLV